MNGFTSDFKFLLIAYVFQIFYAELVSSAIKKLKKTDIRNKNNKIPHCQKRGNKEYG